MLNIKISDIVKATKGKLLKGDTEDYINHVSNHSADIDSKTIYFALIGEVHDGHDFLIDAYNNGCRSFIIDKAHEFNKDDINLIEVKDTLDALMNLAIYYKSLFDIPFIGVTGSVGKTSTKDIIHSVLNIKYKTLKNVGNFNNQIGIPRTIFNLDYDYKLAVLEMGIGNPHEMEQLENIVKPDVAVISNIGMSHIENFGSQEAIFQNKLLVAKNFNENNLLVINGDDPYLSKLKNENIKYQILSYGFNDNNDIYCSKYEINNDSLYFDCIYQDNTYSFTIPSLAKHNILNSMAAILIGLHFKIEIKDIKEGLKNFEITKSRLEVIKSAKYTIIDDTYNASSDSMISALNVLSNYKERKVAILGDIFEVGTFSKEIHTNVGKNILGNTDILITIGKDAKYISDEASKDMNLDDIYHFNDKEEFYNVSSNILKDNDVILIKASNGMKFNEIVDYLKV